MAGTGSAPRQTMAERYGAPSPARRGAAVLGTCALAVAGLAWLAWAAWGQGAPGVRGELASFTVVSEHEVSVTIDVRRPDGEGVDCTVTAKAADFAVVGDDTVTISPGAAASLTYEVTLRTEREATSVTVEDCREMVEP